MYVGASRCRQVGRLSVVTPNAGPVITTADVKLHLRVDHSTEDTPIAAALAAAVEELDVGTKGWLGRSILSQTLKLTLDSQPPDVLYLPGPPVTSVSSVKYRDEDDVIQTIASSEYLSDLTAEPALLWIGENGWPSDMKCDGPDLVRIEYVAGYANAAAVPKAVRQWLLIRAAELYRDREGSVLGVTTTPLRHVDRMLDNLRVRA